jgi:PST family polysaccharide transporter
MDHEGGLRPAEIMRRAAVGAVVLGGGQVAAQVVNIAGMIALARILTPAEFGLVAILTFFLSLLTALGDLGLGMSLVRSPVEPTESEFRAVSSFQQAVALCVTLAALAATPLMIRAYKLAAPDWWLFPVMALAIVADSVRFLPLVTLERRLIYQRVGAIEFTQAVVSTTVLLGLALSGAHAACFPVAVVARSVAAAIVANLIGPRRHGWLWHWPTAKHFLSVGLPYQGVILLTAARNSIVPVFIGLLLGRAAVGHLDWATMVAGFPLTGLILFQRLYVGSFSRMHRHPEELAGFVTRVLSIAHTIVAPVAVVTLVLLDPIVRIVFGEAWVVAIPLVRWLWLGCLVMPTIAPLTGLLHALGRSRTVLACTLAGLVLMWVAGVPLVLSFGETGGAMAMLAIHAVGIVIWSAARRLVPFKILASATLTWAAALPAGALAFWWHRTWPLISVPQLILCGAAAVVVYAAVLWITNRPRVSISGAGRKSPPGDRKSTPEVDL